MGVKILICVGLLVCFSLAIGLFSGGNSGGNSGGSLG